MPTNRAMQLGVVLIVASACVWVGAEFTRRVAWMIPYTMILGIVALVLGVAMELRARQLRRQDRLGG